jgi:hypothetical protein
MKVRLDLRKLERVVVAVALTLRLSVLAFACLRALPRTARIFAPIPSEGQGSTLSTWYLCLTLVLSCAFLLAVAIAKRSEGAPFAVHWLILSGAVFVAMLDAFTKVHDLLDWAILSGWARDISWTVPVGLLVFVFAGAYIPFLRHLSRRERTLLVTAGIVYLLGALVLEVPLCAWSDAHGSESFGSTLLTWVQGTLELAGSSILLLLVAAIFHRSVGRVRLELI